MWIWLWWITNRCVGIVSPRSMCVNELKLRSMINQEKHEIIYEGMWSDCILLRFVNILSWIDLMLFDDRFIHIIFIIQMKDEKEWNMLRRGLLSNTPSGISFNLLLLSELCSNQIKSNQTNGLWCECDSSFKLRRLLNIPELRDLIEFESRCLCECWFKRMLLLKS